MATPSSASPTPKRKFDEASLRADSPLFVSQLPDGTDEEDGFDADVDVDVDVEDEGEPAYKYSEASEPLPRDPAFDSDLTTATSRSMAAVQKLHDLLTDLAPESKSLQNMLTKAKDALIHPQPQRHTIAMVGDTGAGKSALLNSITDVPRLAKEVSAGESCTSVPTIYTSELLWQNEEPFAAEILYYDIERCRQLLAEQVKAYNVYTFEFDNAWDNDEKAQKSQEASTALGTFQTLFCHVEQFESTRAAKEHLQACYQDDSAGLVERMVKWCEEHFDGHEKEGGAGYERCTGETAADLNEQVDPLVAPKHTMDEPSLWPLVEKVTVGVRCSRILEYVNIMDLPGITDTNRLRVDTTHANLRKCHALWYVVGIPRACTDDNLERVLDTYAERFAGTLAIIVTKCDIDIGGVSGQELAKDMRNKGQSTGLFAEYMEQSRQLQKNINRLEAQLRRKQSPEKLVQLYETKKGLEEDRDRADIGGNEAIADSRNTYVIRRLQKEKQKYVRDGSKVPVWPVSNTQYVANKTRGVQPMLNMEATGIPALRAFGICLAAPTVWSAMEGHLLHKICVLFYGARLWAEESALMDHADLIELVKNIHQIWHVHSDAIQPKAQAIVDESLMSKLRGSLAMSLEHALCILDELSSIKWHPSSFIAFFRKDGRHGTRAVAPQSWNERFVEHHAKEVLKPAWKGMQEQLTRALKDSTYKLSNTIEDLPDQLSRNPDSVSLPISAFGNMLDAQVHGINDARENHLASFTTGLANSRLDAETDHLTSFFTRAMQPCYELGKTDRGTGVCKRLKALLHVHLTQNNPFATMNSQLSASIKRNVANFSNSLHEDVNEILNDIVTSFEGILLRQAETPAEAEARVKLSNLLNECMADIEGLKDELAGIKQRYERPALGQ